MAAKKMKPDAEYSSASTAKQDWPINLLDAIAGGDWEHDLPADFEPSLAYVLAFLSEREQRVIEGRYRAQRKLDDVAQEICVTRERTRQIEAKAICKLRHPVRMNCLIYGMRGIADKMFQQKLMCELSDAIKYITEIAEAIKSAGGTDALVQFAETRRLRSEQHPSADVPLSKVTLSVRSYNVLHRAGKDTLGDVADMTWNELTSLRNMGKKSADEIIHMLERYGLSLKPEENVL